MNRRPAQAKVLFLPEVRNYFEELSVILYQKNISVYMRQLYNMPKNYSPK